MYDKRNWTTKETNTEKKIQKIPKHRKKTYLEPYINNDENHTAFPSQTPKTRRTIGKFFKTVGNKLEWI